MTGLHSVVIVCPVLGHVDQIAPMVASLRASSEARIVFVCSPKDRDAIVECNRSGEDVLVAPWEPGKADFAKKTNLAFRETAEEFLFCAATDLRFWPEWERQVLMVAERSNAGVIGTQDRGNALVKRGAHSTHPLVRRSYCEDYGTFDRTGEVYCELYDHQYCCPPEAPIWMADLSFRPIGEVNEGDWVIGWHWPDSQASYKMRRLTRSQVLSTSERHAPLIRVVMESGRELRCTPDHLWLNALWSPRAPYAKEWMKARVGGSLLQVMDQPEDVPPHLMRIAGWLGGIFDGEGNMSSSNPQIGQSQSANPGVYNRICGALDAFDIPYTASEDRVWLKGGRREILRFFHIAQPWKATRFAEFILDQARFGQRDKIVHIEPDGDGWVYSMQTTTGNYIAWGYASRNCDLELVETAKMRGAWAFAKRSVVEHLHPNWHKADWDDTYTKAFAKAKDDRALYVRRMRQYTALTKRRRAAL